MKPQEFEALAAAVENQALAGTFDKIDWLKLLRKVLPDYHSSLSNDPDVWDKTAYDLKRALQYLLVESHPAAINLLPRLRDLKTIFLDSPAEGVRLFLDSFKKEPEKLEQLDPAHPFPYLQRMLNESQTKVDELNPHAPLKGLNPGRVKDTVLQSRNK